VQPLPPTLQSPGTSHARAPHAGGVGQDNKSPTLMFLAELAWKMATINRAARKSFIFKAIRAELKTGTSRTFYKPCLIDLLRNCGEKATFSCKMEICYCLLKMAVF
jgi:hypothetical protein